MNLSPLIFLPFPGNKKLITFPNIKMPYPGVGF